MAYAPIGRNGRGGDYASRYTRGELARDARRIGEYLAGGRDVFIYFNNDALGYAPVNARELSKMFAA